MVDNLLFVDQQYFSRRVETPLSKTSKVFQRSWYKSNVGIFFFTLRTFITYFPKLDEFYCGLFRCNWRNVETDPPFYKLLSEEVELIESPSDRELSVFVWASDEVSDKLLSRGVNFRILYLNGDLVNELFLHVQNYEIKFNQISL